MTSRVLWRICRRARAKTAFDGEGARKFPGRWNERGVPVVYCASTLSLATLEYLVHVDPDDLPDDLVSLSATAHPSIATERIPVSSLPKGWRASPAPVALQRIGSKWAAACRTALLIVPSAVTPNEENVLVNPLHPAAAKLRIAKPQRFTFDPRLRD